MNSILLSVLLSQAQPVPTHEFIVHQVESRSNIDADVAHFVGMEILDKSKEHGVDPLLVLAVMKVESDFRPNVVSHAGARGIMQVMPATERWVLSKIIPDSIHLGWNDPVSNTAVGVAYLGWLTEKYKGDLEKVLVAYNSGPGYVDRTLRERRKLPAERMLYSLLVKKELRLLREELARNENGLEQDHGSAVDGSDRDFVDWIDLSGGWAGGPALLSHSSGWAG